MKTKILMSVLAIGMAIALISGATMAWFTAEADVNPATFTAGTVIVNADGPEYFTAEGKSFNNVNPGDCGRVEWTIINDGTKAAQLKVKLEKRWEDGYSTDNVRYAPAENSGWVMYEESDGIWLYYIAEPDVGVPGTFNGASEEERSVPLELIVAFDGEDTTDIYQGKTFTLSGKVYAIQASNDAPSEVWGDAWDAVTDPEYKPEGLAAAYLEYIQGTKCWDGEEEEEEEEEEEPNGPEKFLVSADIVDEGNGSVRDLGEYEEGALVTLVAEAENGFVFKEWSGHNDLPDVQVNGNILTFIMPNYDVKVTAIFEAEEVPDVIDYDYKDLKVSAWKTGQGLGTKTNVKIEGKVRGYKINGQIQHDIERTIKGYVSGYESHIGQTTLRIHGSGWTNFAIQYQINGNHVNNINGKNSLARIEIDGVVKPPQQ